MFAVTVALRISFAVVLFLAQLINPLLQLPQPETENSPEAHEVALAPLAGQPLRISQVFAGGGTATAYPWDFIELFNMSDQAVYLKGWYIRTASATGNYLLGTGLGDRTIPANGYFLLGGTGSLTAPVQPDFIGALIADLQVSGGKVRLVDPTGKVVDQVGYGPASEYETSPAPALTTTTAILRRGSGCTDTDNNSADFEVAAPAARNAASAIQLCKSESGPTVSSTVPTNGATGVARDANLTITFSEPVEVADGWFEVVCDLSGIRNTQSATVTPSEDRATYTINPTADLYGDDSCTLTVFADAISDDDTTDPPDNLASDHRVTFRTAPGECGDPAYGIHSIQGVAGASLALDQWRTIEGVVTGDFQGLGSLSGFFVQEEPGDTDANPQTSEAIFVDEHAAALNDVTAGALVRLTGRVTEAQGLTSLANISSLIDCGSTDLPPRIQPDLPITSPEAWEQYEGMLVQFSQQLTVSDSEALSSRGQLQLVASSLPPVYTQAHAPDLIGFAGWESDLAANTVILDDGSELAYPDPIRYPPPGLAANHTVRAGDVIEPGLTGIVDSRGGVFVIQPTDEPSFTSQNSRSASPVQAAGNIRVAFMSLDDYFRVVNDAGGPRGASSDQEFERQRTKVIATLAGLDADIIGVSQLANDGYEPTGSLADLVDGLNAASNDGPYAFVNGGQPRWGADAVAVGIIYRTSTVVQIGQPAILDTGAFSQAENALLHRVPMAQSFEEKTLGERFTVVINEWHNRSDCPADGANADPGDGQGCWNAARTSAAQDLAVWLAADPTQCGDPDVLILGELNAFAQENPIRTLVDNQYTDLMGRFVGPNAVTILANGRVGASDHALASPSLAAQVVGAGVWNINAEEPPALDYQTENKSATQLSSLYAPDHYRSASQNPVTVDLELAPDKSDLGGEYGLAWHTGQGVWRLGDAWGGEDDGITSGAGSWNNGEGEIIVTVNGPAGQYACLYGWFDYSDGQITPGVADEPDGGWDPNERVIAGVPLASGRDQSVRFSLPIGSIKPAADLNLRYRLVPAPDPDTADCASAVSIVQLNAELGPTGRADGGEVEDHVISTAPLAVDMASFTARATGAEIVISWETISEEDVVGFNLFRREPGAGWSKLNTTLIAGRTPCAGQGHRYEWIDRQVAPGAVYAYRLEELGLDGKTVVHGPVEASTEAPTTVTISEFRGATDARLSVTGLILGLVTLAAIAYRTITTR